MTRTGLALALALAVAACGEDDETGLRPVVEQIGPAIEAVEAQLGGPQRYFEVNATPQFVNLFVANDDATEVEVFLYTDGELAPPTPPEEASGATFAADAVAFDPDEILAGVHEELPGSDIVVFAVVGGPDGSARYSATVQSDEGGVLDIALDATGEVLGVDPGE